MVDIGALGRGSFATVNQRPILSILQVRIRGGQLGLTFLLIADTIGAEHLALTHIQGSLIDEDYDLIGDAMVALRNSPSGGAGYLLKRSMVEKLVLSLIHISFHLKQH